MSVVAVQGLERRRLPISPFWLDVLTANNGISGANKQTL
jgi:hypothetical protein